MSVAQGSPAPSTVTPQGTNSVGEKLYEKTPRQNLLFSPFSLFPPLQFLYTRTNSLNKKELSLPVSLEAKEALDVWIIPL